MKVKVLMLLSCIALCAFGAAQTVRVNRNGNTENLNKVRPGSAVNSQDRSFFKVALETNLLEIKLGELAQRKGNSEFVREYGMMMVREHTMGFNELKVIGGKTRLPVSKNLSSASQNAIARLARLSGAAFDNAYRAEMIKGHNAFLIKLEQEIKRGNNSLIRNYAVTAAPVVRLHGKMAERRVTKI